MPIRYCIKRAAFTLALFFLVSAAGSCSANDGNLNEVSTPSGVSRVGPDSIWPPLARETIEPLVESLRSKVRAGLCPSTDTFAQCATRLSETFGYEKLVYYYDILRQMNCVGRPACALQVMRENGATPEAAAFFERTGWILTDLKSAGPIGIGVVFNPWLLNSNYQFVILNGKPARIFPADSSRLNITGDPVYAALVAKYSRQDAAPANISVWPSDAQLESVVAAANSGIQLFVQFNIVNGCHACGTGYAARFSFDFALDGTMNGVTLIDICHYSSKEDEVMAPECPPAKSP